MTVRLLVLVASIAVASLGLGCSSQFGEEEKIGCLPVTTTVLALDESSALGFSGQDVLDTVGTAHTGELVYADGTRTALTVSVAYEGGEVRFLDNEWIDDSGRDLGAATDCLDTVEVEARVGFATADGAFAESWAVALVASDATMARFYRTFEGLSGTFDPEAHVPPGEMYDTVTAWLEGSFDATGARGEVIGGGEQSEGSGPDGTVSMTRIDMASWTATPDDMVEAGAGCLPVTTTALGPSDASPLGFSGDDVLSWAATSYAFTLTYADGTTTPATLAVTYSGGVIEHRDNEWMSTDGSEIAPALGCEDDLRIEVSIAFHTDDGTFDETWSTAIVATEATRATLYRELGAATGSFDPADYAPAGHSYDAIRAFLDLTLESAGSTGTIEGQGEGTSGSGPDGTAYAETFAIASW